MVYETIERRGLRKGPKRTLDDIRDASHPSKRTETKPKQRSRRSASFEKDRNRASTRAHLQCLSSVSDTSDTSRGTRWTRPNGRHTPGGTVVVAPDPPQVLAPLRRTPPYKLFTPDFLKVHRESDDGNEFLKRRWSLPLTGLLEALGRRDPQVPPPWNHGSDSVP